MLDAICYEHYNAQPGATEAVLNANPGLAKLGALLPLGVKINLPILPVTSSTGTISLWD